MDTLIDVSSHVFSRNLAVVGNDAKEALEAAKAFNRLFDSRATIVSPRSVDGGTVRLIQTSSHVFVERPYAIKGEFAKAIKAALVKVAKTEGRSVILCGESSAMEEYLFKHKVSKKLFEKVIVRK